MAGHNVFSLGLYGTDPSVYSYPGMCTAGIYQVLIGSQHHMQPAVFLVFLRFRDFVLAPREKRLHIYWKPLLHLVVFTFGVRW